MPEMNDSGGMGLNCFLASNYPYTYDSSFLS
jgi:hypothetical protein